MMVTSYAIPRRLEGRTCGGVGIHNWDVVELQSLTQFLQRLEDFFFKGEIGV
jgi:hypothetical protein